MESDFQLVLSGHTSLSDAYSFNEEFQQIWLIFLGHEMVNR